MTFEMGLMRDPFEKMERGEKLVELRLFDGKRQALSPGDSIRFFLEPERTKWIDRRIEGLLHYGSFRNLLADIGADLCGFSTSEEALNELKKFYAPEKEQAHGVVGIRLSPHGHR